MRRLTITLIAFLLLSVYALAQKPAAKPAVVELKKLLTATGLPYRMTSDSLASIPYGGQNVESYNVIVQKVSDLYIIYTNLSEVLPGKLNSEKYKYLLEQNNHFDIVKIGISSDDTIVYLRADVYRSGLTAALLKRIITQVGNVTNIIAGDLK